jgi:pyrroloquinoline quinone (PQQ) biosynthesis protein C
MKQPEETTTPKSGGIIAYLDDRIELLIKEIETTPVWKAIVNPKTKPELVRAIMREVYLEIAGYQPHVIEAAIASVGQMPRTMPVRMIKAMLRHQAEEFDHGEMAVRDYVALGGDESHARDPRAISNESFAVAGVWWMITKLRDPFAYLGALYPFEGLTPIVSAKVKAVLAGKQYPENALEYIEFHSTEDIKHANLIKALIEETVKRYPEAERSIMEGMERFLAVYPIPVWNAAYERARGK